MINLTIEPISQNVDVDGSAYVTVKGLDDNYSWMIYRSDTPSGNGSVVYNYTEETQGDILYIFFEGMFPEDTGYYYFVVNTPDGEKQSSTRFYINAS